MPDDSDDYLYLGTEFDYDGVETYFWCMPSDTQPVNGECDTDGDDLEEVEWDTVVKSGQIMRIKASNGRLSWSLHHDFIERATELACLPKGEGVVGCGSYIGSVNFFGITYRGSTDFH
jgi:hypothetical protein